MRAAPVWGGVGRWGDKGVLGQRSRELKPIRLPLAYKGGCLGADTVTVVLSGGSVTGADGEPGGHAPSWGTGWRK